MFRRWRCRPRTPRCRRVRAHWTWRARPRKQAAEFAEDYRCVCGLLPADGRSSDEIRAELASLTLTAAKLVDLGTAEQALSPSDRLGRARLPAGSARRRATALHCSGRPKGWEHRADELVDRAATRGEPVGRGDFHHRPDRDTGGIMDRLGGPLSLCCCRTG
ncbi:MAG: hypothetical protein M5R42_06605 [Rhodocyclaceae bacterium]|nr:hypothetical protein [Rhodocyclaceae bacterium]